MDTTQFSGARRRLAGLALAAALLGAAAAPAAAAVSSGTIYSGAAKAGKVVRITNPSGTQVDAAGTLLPTLASVIGTTSDGRGALGVAVANHSDGTPGRSLYLAEGSDITEIPDPANCSGTCVASPTGMLASTLIGGKAVLW